MNHKMFPGSNTSKIPLQKATTPEAQMQALLYCVTTSGGIRCKNTPGNTD